MKANKPVSNRKTPSDAQADGFANDSFKDSQILMQNELYEMDTIGTNSKVSLHFGFCRRFVAVCKKIAHSDRLCEQNLH